jgi:hypothetical protein
LSSASFLESCVLRAPVFAPGTARRTVPDQREAGILPIRWRLTGSGAAADRLWSAIERKAPDPTNEALRAAPGTMVAASHMQLRAGEARRCQFLLARVEQQL